MNKVLILSDSHGLTKEVNTIKMRHQVDEFIHCGDSELDFDSEELNGMRKVAGNCDFDTNYPNEEVLSFGDLTFFVTHGHLHNVKLSVMSLSYRAQEIGANVICFGHTHIAGAEQINEQLFINPGSIRLPRNRPDKTYAVMEWESSNDLQVNFYTVDGEKVNEMTYHASL